MKLSSLSIATAAIALSAGSAFAAAPNTATSVTAGTYLETAFVESAGDGGTGACTYAGVSTGQTLQSVLNWPGPAKTGAYQATVTSVPISGFVLHVIAETYPVALPSAYTKSTVTGWPTVYTSTQGTSSTPTTATSYSGPAGSTPSATSQINPYTFTLNVDTANEFDGSSTLGIIIAGVGTCTETAQIFGQRMGK